MWDDDGGLMWKDTYAIGVELIDGQHKELFHNVTEGLLMSIQSPDTYKHKNYCINTISFLKGYVVQHFKDEETYQLSINYEGYEAHKQKHINLAKSVKEYEILLAESDFALPIVKRFMAFVLRWLINHVAEEDSQIRRSAFVPSAASSA